MENTWKWRNKKQVFGRDRGGKSSDWSHGEMDAITSS